MSWAAYQESMPSACDLSSGSGSNPSGDYAPKHNPAAYYLPLRASCRQHVCRSARRPRARSRGRSRPARSRASASSRPTSATTRTTARSRPETPGSRAGCMTIVSSPVYRAERTVIFVTWDEGEGGDRMTAPATRATPDATSPRSSSARRRGPARARLSSSITTRCSGRPSNCSASGATWDTRETPAACVRHSSCRSLRVYEARDRGGARTAVRVGDAMGDRELVARHGQRERSARANSTVDMPPPPGTTHVAAGRGPVGGVVDAQRVAALPARHARDPVVAERRHQRSRGTRQQPRAMRRGMDREAGVPPDGTQAGGRTGGQARLGARPMVTERTASAARTARPRDAARRRRPRVSDPWLRAISVCRNQPRASGIPRVGR